MRNQTKTLLQTFFEVLFFISNLIQLIELILNHLNM